MSHMTNKLSTTSSAASAFTFWTYLLSKFSSQKVRKIVLALIAAYVSVKLLKRWYKRQHDKVKYVTLSHVLNSKKRYDFIVVGAGTSGSCVAGLLARDNRRPNVLLIEAGDRDTYHPWSTDVIPVFTRLNQKTSKDWQYYTVPQQGGCDSLKGRKSNWPRGRIMGGSSVLNYMVWVKGDPRDYDEWSELHGCKGWSSKDLTEVWKSLERCVFKIANAADTKVRGLRGLQTITRKSDAKQWKFSQLFIEAAQKAGFAYNDDYNGQAQDGVSYTQFNIDENGRRLTSFRAFVATLFSSNTRSRRSAAVADAGYNIDILGNAQVTKILCKPQQTKQEMVAYGVQLNGDKTANVYINEDRAGEVIVCGGAVGSPHLLLLSGIGDAQQLQQHNIPMQCEVPGVGRNLRDHIMQAFRVSFKNESLRNEPGIVYDGTLFQNLSAMKEYVLSGKGPMAGTGLDAHIFTKSCVAAKHATMKSNDLQLVQILIGEEIRPNYAVEQTATFFNYDHEKDDQTKWPKKNQRLSDDELQKSVLATVMLVRPQSVGSLTLQSADPNVSPAIDPKYLSHPDDIAAFMDGWKKLRSVYEKEPFKSMGAEVVEYEKFETDEQFAEYMIQNYMMTIYHPVGTCKMGNLAKDKMAVTSERCKVRGFCNLRVADASSAPDLVAGNTQAMCYVIGCKAAQMILHDWQR